MAKVDRDHFDDWQDEERDGALRARRRRPQLDARGTLRVAIEQPEQPEWLRILRARGLL